MKTWNDYKEYVRTVGPEILKYQNCFPMCSLMIANVESTVNGNAIKKSLIKIAQLSCDFVAHF